MIKKVYLIETDIDYMIATVGEDIRFLSDSNELIIDENFDLASIEDDSSWADGNGGIIEGTDIEELIQDDWKIIKETEIEL